ncbi:MAG: greA [Conexibacter sp.]|jgi:transcription elongation factor GreA|nr:greA [Conexibacter sp.]MCZ4493055.1 greA [Conexibacter sp.]MDX6730254.1 transcription elongation factor GreA [Baekduia sp.]
MAEAITADGLAQLKSELEALEGEGRRQIAQRILVARELGDLSENAEYHAAKEDQAHLETKIARLTERLRNATVVESDADATVVTFGATVNVTDVSSGKTTTYTIVGATEADLKVGRLSAESPVAKALIGTAPGDTVAVSTPRGTRQFKVESLG